MKNEKEQSQEILPPEQTAHSTQGEQENSGKQDKPDKRDIVKQLSPQDKEKLKKAIVFSAMGILFVLFMWLVFCMLCTSIQCSMLCSKTKKQAEHWDMLLKMQLTARI